MPVGKAVAVAISIHVINLASIDEAKQQFEIDGYLMLHWIDPRLAFTRTGLADLHREHDRTAVWIPHVEMVNAVAPRERYDTSTEGDSDGAVKYIEGFHAVLCSKFMLRRFPFDSQSLLIIMHPYLRQERQVEFSAYNPHVWATPEFSQYSSLVQWNLQSVLPSIGTSSPYTGLQVPETRFTIKVERRYAFYLWKVFLPLLLMVVLSRAVFWIEARDLSNQAQIAITTILTVIAFAISATMPRVPYLTYIDAFFLACYVFVFVSIVELFGGPSVASPRAVHRPGNPCAANLPLGGADGICGDQPDPDRTVSRVTTRGCTVRFLRKSLFAEGFTLRLLASGNRRAGVRISPRGCTDARLVSRLVN